MPCELRRFRAFERQLHTIFKIFPNSQKHIENNISKLSKKPRNGDRYPGFGELEIRKLRIPLKAYNIGKSKGLRIITIYVPEKNIIAPLVIYKKGNHGSEKDVKSLIMSTIKEVKEELP
ncbi:MAG: hypothetical protein ABFS18_01215 [Thermodesulfobacteriota bacterium]